MSAFLLGAAMGYLVPRYGARRGWSWPYSLAVAFLLLVAAHVGPWLIVQALA